MEKFVDLFTVHAHLTDKEKCHHYGYLYDGWTAGMQIKSVLELGCTGFGGGGLISFSKAYPDACVVGVDDRDNNSHNILSSCPNVHLLIGDVYAEGTALKAMADFGSFDLIVDDCVHKKQYQFDAFELWSPLLSREGLYIIEDVFEHEVLDLLSRLSKYGREWQVFFGDTRHLQRNYGMIPDIMLGLKRYKL